MSKLRTLKRGLNQYRVARATVVERKQKEEDIKTKEFVSDVIKASDLIEEAKEKENLNN